MQLDLLEAPEPPAPVVIRRSALSRWLAARRDQPQALRRRAMERARRQYAKGPKQLDLEDA